MKFKFMALAMALLMVAGFSLSSTAGSVTDTDGDAIPDDYDNCDEAANGAGDGVGNQTDTDGDGYGNFCDTDYDQDGATLGADFTALTAAFGTANDNIDTTGDGLVLGNDFTKLANSFGLISLIFPAAPTARAPLSSDKRLISSPASI